VGPAQMRVVVIGLALVMVACAAPSGAPAPGRSAPAAPAAGAPAAASGSAPAAATGAPARESFKLGYPNLSLSYLSMLMAREHGLYAQEGLDADVQQMRANVGQAALVAGEVEFTAAVGSSVKMALQGAPIKTIMLLVDTQVMTLVARPEIRSVPQLRGRTVGVGVAGASIDQVARLVLKHHGLEPQQDVNVVPIGDGAIQYEALRLGQIDAAMMSLPFPILGRREGYSILAHSHEIFKLPSAGITVLQSTIEQRRDMVRRMARAQIRALQLVREQPDAAVRFIEEFFEMDPQTARDPYEYLLPVFSKTGAVDREAMEFQIEQERASGLATSLGYDDVVDTTIVADALRDLGLR
jgi:ABC-type nitrate/sulfonate/bicarbonate transport system substrate-binding protein